MYDKKIDKFLSNLKKGQCSDLISLNLAGNGSLLVEMVREGIPELVLSKLEKKKKEKKTLAKISLKNYFDLGVGPMNLV